jgi:cytochrome oxidase Cu insertion factor (SCO1/SenC/PrrC family)
MRIGDVRSSTFGFAGAMACAMWAAIAEPAGAAATAEGVFAEMGVEPVTPPAPAPELVLRAADGSSIRLADFRGKVVVLEFFVTT